ncbi:membrane cofactor protein-like isoform X2 [Diceros bicornis minor]|uniref:membrane cofactor protein-like isoform X2 n=1 Tax=Diceros bicornis minor TaxID=77932 RepID=UPI0026F3104E|nr:membrane cofactor protein-like isoform X2 [Diceros bicornis minor]
MTASCAPRTAPPCRPESHFSSLGLVGVLLGALVLLLPVFSDACGDPPRFNSMRVRGVAQSSYRPGDTIEYECRLGYTLKRPPLATSTVCQPDNTWTPLQEACTRKLCLQPGEPINGEVRYVNGTLEFGSQIHYACNEGFNLIGQKILYCELVGETVNWSDNPPLCQVMSCSPPPKIQNGKYTRSDQEEFSYNDVVTYSCDPSNGPDEYSLVGESRLVCSGNDKWSSDPPECKVVKCEHPLLENGRLVSGFGKKFYYKATVVFECEEGFYLSGSNTVVCGANSTWEPAMPTCIKVSTLPSTKPPVSSVSVSTLHSRKPPKCSVSGHPSSGDESPPLKNVKTLGGGIIALIVVTLLASQ